jgi:hypothetical protein
VLAALLPPAARMLAGPEGAIVHVRWKTTVDEDTRRQLEARFRLAGRENLGGATWRYDLLDPSPGNIRAIVENPSVDDTSDINRAAFSLEPPAIRTLRRQRMARGSDLVAAADLIAIIFAALAAAVVSLHVLRRVPTVERTLQSALGTLRALARPPSVTPVNNARVSFPENPQTSERPRVWTAVAMIASAPVVIVLCATLWRMPFPVTEVVAMLEDMEDQPIARYLTPYRTYYRPLYHLTLSAFWNHGGSLDAKLAVLKLCTIVLIALLVALFVWFLRPRTAIEAAAAGLAVAVLMGSPGFRDNLEIGLHLLLVGMMLAMLAWIWLNRQLSVWHVPLIILCLLMATGFKEQGLLLAPLVIGAWWTRAPGASRGMAATAAAITLAYLGFRLIGSGSWTRFESGVGFGFEEISPAEALTRFGAFPYGIYAYNVVSTIGNILFTEPSRGIFQFVHAVLEGNAQPWQIIEVGSSIVLTGVMAWWGVRCLADAARSGWTQESRVCVAMVLAVLGTGVLTFNYSRERLEGVAAVFYALASFFAVRAAAVRMLDASRARFVMMGLVLVLLAATWQVRAVATLEWARVRSWGNQREWLVSLPQRRLEFAHRATYLRIMDSMIGQGTDLAAPRPLRVPRWVVLVLGQPRL